MGTTTTSVVTEAVIWLSVSVLAGIFIRGIWIYVQNFRFLLRFPNVGFAWPLIGNAHKVMFLAREDRAPVARRLMEEADPRKRKVATVFGPNRMIWLFHPETAGKILGSNDIVTKSLEYKPLIPWLGEGLLVSGGEKWRRRRKQLTPAFHFSILEDCMATFNRNADLLCDILIEDGLGGKETLDLFPYVCRCTLDIILESAMGRSIGVQKSRGTGDDGPGAGYARALSEIVELITQRQITPWLYPDFLFSLSEVKRRQDKCLEVLRGFTRGVIRERKKELGVVADESGSHKKKRLAFLDLLLQTDPPLDEKDLQDEVDTFTFGGHDTTGCAISWALLMLANNPEVQNRARLEQEEIFGDDDLEAEASMEDLTKMKYLEACIKEALRLYPSVPIVGRMLEKDVFIDGELVPEGTEAIVPIFILHRNSEIWEDPDEFRPGRFISESSLGSKSLSPFSYVPFSAGPRNCIGQRFALMEEKAVLSRILRRTNKIEAVDKTEDVSVLIDGITRPNGGVRARFFQRPPRR